MTRSSVIVIAEAGVNHNGSLKTALELVRAAAEAGADVVKFQTFEPTEIAAASAPTADYQKNSIGDHGSQRSMLEQLTLTRDEWTAIRDQSRSCGVEFLSTAFDRSSLRLLVELGIRRIKVPSGEITNRRLLEYVADQGLPVLLSTGMADMREVRAAVDVMVGRGVRSEALTVLHCTSSYPAPAEDLNLLALESLRQEFGVAVGYSDHSNGPEASVAAVALGATVIEKHLTLDATAIGPDHAASMEPTEFRQMVAMIRNVEKAIGDGVKRCMPSELEVKAVARRSLVAAKHLEAGTLITEEMVRATRPGTGVSPMLIDQFVGRPARRTYLAGEALE